MGTVTRSVLVRRSVEEVAKEATNPGVVLPIIGGFGRFEFIVANPDGSQEWDLFLDLRTVQVGGRVLVEPPAPNRLAWRSLRGKSHHAVLDVVPGEGGAELNFSITVAFVGAVTGRLTGYLAEGILARHIEAGLQQLRHHLEYGA